MKPRRASLTPPPQDGFYVCDGRRYSTKSDALRVARQIAAEDDTLMNRLAEV